MLTYFSTQRDINAVEKMHGQAEFNNFISRNVSDTVTLLYVTLTHFR